MTDSAPGATGAPGVTFRRTADDQTMTIDAHQHFWNLRREPMPWMKPEHVVIARDFEPSDLRPLLDACRIDGTSSSSRPAPTATPTRCSRRQPEHPWICAATAWVDLLSPERAQARLDALAPEPALRGSAT